MVHRLMERLKRVGVWTDWAEVLDSHVSVSDAPFDCVIHCAARAHARYETESDTLAAYRSMNVADMRRLAEKVAAEPICFSFSKPGCRQESDKDVLGRCAAAHH